MLVEKENTGKKKVSIFVINAVNKLTLILKEDIKSV